MPRNYLPTSDSGLETWATDFADLVVASPATYGVALADAEALGTKLSAYTAALATATNPSTRTTPAVQAKRTAKAELIAAIRPMVQTIQNFSGTTDTMRAELKITIRDTNPTPVPPPDESPLLEVVAVTGRVIKIKLRPATGEGRAKPDGVKGGSVYYAVGDDYPQGIEGWTFKGNTTQTTVDVTIPEAVPGGAKVWLTAQWFNTKAQTGPACAPVETRIAGGLSQAA